MLIYVLRHGIAEDAGPRVSDADRRLTEHGRDKLDAVLKTARRGNVRPELVLSSPLVRAVETAELARNILDVESPLQITSVLTPDGIPQNVWDEIRILRKLDSVLVAGHEPLLSHLTAWLLGAPSLQVHMTKAALVAVELDAFGNHPRGVLKWMITPKIVDA